MTPKMTTTNQNKPAKIPRKLNDALIVALSGFVAKGYFANRACYLCNIDEHTLTNWRNLGEIDFKAGVDSLYSRLYTSLKKAHAEAQARLVDVMMDTAVVKRNWLAAARTLESTDRENWWRADKVVVNNSKTINITRVTYVMPEGGEPHQVIEGESREVKELDTGQDRPDNSQAD